MTYRVLMDPKQYQCIQCGRLDNTRASAEMHATYHMRKAEREMRDDPEYKPLRKPEPEPPVKVRRRSAGALR